MLDIEKKLKTALTISCLAQCHAFQLDYSSVLGAQFLRRNIVTYGLDLTTKLSLFCHTEPNALPVCFSILYL